MRYTLPLALALATLASGTTTHVVGILSATATTSGTTAPVNGYVLLSWHTFTASDSTVYPGNTERLQITNGVFDAELEPAVYSLTWGNIAALEYRLLTVPAEGPHQPFPAARPITNLAACLTLEPNLPTLQFAIASLSPSGATIGQAITYTATGWAATTIPGLGAIPISGITGLQTALTGEASTRAAADTLSVAALASEATTRGAAIASETAARAIDTATATAAMVSEVSTRAAAIASETSARQVDTATAATATSAEITARAAAVATESAARSTADTAASTALTGETTARAAAIASESAARVAAMATEAAARAAGDASSYTAGFTAALLVTIPGATHQLGTAELTAVCHDAAGTRYEPDSITVDPTTYTAAIAHAIAQTGSCTLHR